MGQPEIVSENLGSENGDSIDGTSNSFYSEFIAENE